MSSESKDAGKSSQQKEEDKSLQKKDEVKSSWPELVGVDGKDAQKTAEKENPAVKAAIVPEGSFVIMDFRVDRVRIWVDEQGLVTRVPKIG
ncbi:hypothetical protein UlMin_009864 [Ulmus minor]